MPKAGYHPVCVLFQGNDSPYDGTYQLICRHQIKDNDFKPGDVVEVRWHGHTSRMEGGVEVWTLRQKIYISGGNMLFGKQTGTYEIPQISSKNVQHCPPPPR